MKLDKTKAPITIWLAKLPPFLSSKLESLTGEKTIGEIVMESPTKVTFKLTSEMSSMRIPMEYSISFSDREEKSYVVFENDEECEVAGYINKELFIIPNVDSSYLNALKARSSVGSSIVMIDNTLLERKGGRMGGVSEIDSLARTRKRLLQAKKRERLDKAEVIDIIFKAYEKHSSWSVRDLADFCGQPVAYIQEILPEICTLNKKDYRNLYELKPEYKQ